MKHKKPKTTTDLIVTIVLRDPGGGLRIFYEAGGHDFPGDIVLKRQLEVTFKCAEKFVLYIKGFRPSLSAARRLAAAASRESPADGNQLVFWSNNAGHVKIKRKQNALQGTYPYGVAVGSDSGLIIDDPQIIVD